MHSIMQKNKECYITGATEGLHKHHIYYGNPLRKISEANGFWCYLRYDWHNASGYGIHFDRSLDLQLKCACQAKYEESHTREEFRSIIGKSYL